MSNPQDNTASILQKNKKVLIASLTGSAIEWFDYFLYGTAAALVFNKIFFPMVDPVIGLILSWLSLLADVFYPPHRRRHFRSYRRSHRPQEDAGADPVADGQRHGGDRPASHL
ncbi:hypothetical protein LNO81_12645 [Klebsiella variicola subsp. variicola]|nr:hypothetical protein [Klebsiella variicola subsp. variicola]